MARYDEVYRNCGPLNQLGGIGAHSDQAYKLESSFKTKTAPTRP